MRPFYGEHPSLDGKTADRFPTGLAPAPQRRDWVIIERVTVGAVAVSATGTYPAVWDRVITPLG
jgi:hypothetical protein